MLNFVILIWRASMRSRSSHHLLPVKMAPNCPVVQSSNFGSVSFSQSRNFVAPAKRFCKNDPEQTIRYHAEPH